MGDTTTLGALIAALYDGFLEALQDEELALIATAGSLELMLAARWGACDAPIGPGWPPEGRALLD